MNPSEAESAPKVARMVRCARKLSGLTQKEVCSNLRISQSYLSKIENGINVPSVVFWAEFCQLTGVNMDSVINGYLDDMTFSQVESGRISSGIEIPQRYSYLRSMKIRGLNTLIFFAKNLMGNDGFEKTVTEMGIDPDYFCNYDNQLNINFLTDFLQKIKKSATEASVDTNNIFALVKQESIHGNFAKKLFSDNDPISLIKRLVRNAKKYESNFSYEILDESKNKLVFSLTPEGHLAEFKKNFSDNEDVFLSYLSKDYLNSFIVDKSSAAINESAQENSRRTIEVQC
ncbi:MAG: hypothetical protein A2504_01425 [Bdellovibrionales bacterium RIFOXYD12_FULL_39_22]|nr:MAG: hypothetical protein A2385_02315 [Bdellovibrionales bacterium RIFOXYB1_FULL_39_21]OFZ42767.1 MAG: hypothetical protein A2485_10500 [Bdellovibrionales bacterium RIFOXYC12_FULL_39_17]OFZ47326.1 MAG: hypothetical protein A2404_15105 [Bdellovibrionales bacterium RIFOXYC1_FULL_39_130]OFZ75492.1 MAG: hypothetical protein A2560_04375 [Bdellovibrionales bacterium RIFOXYD1_FULL_39_84]OFZ93446.1 MAG: hypothetical protein A2504_01425 [Bdellovibrionales bacterium RIFOXYD12_FULL_39_22]HLE12421.1 he